MEFRKVFDTIPEQFDKYRPRYSEKLFAARSPRPVNSISEREQSPLKIMLLLEMFSGALAIHP